MSERTPELAIALVLAVLVAGALLLGGGAGGGDGTAASGGEAVSPERLARVERRVERLRGLRFRRPVRVEVLSPEAVRDFGVEQTEKASVAAEDDAREELMKLLGLIEPDVSLDAVTGSIYGEQVAGFYDPESERMALVAGVGMDDVTLAHELTHALEDQHFDLERFDGRGGDDDAATGASGLVEGSATALMTRYLRRHPDALSLGDAFAQLWGASSARPLPPYVMRSLLFPYRQGERFVEALLGTSGDWRLVDEALRDRPPRSTAELYDPERWLRGTRPKAVALPGDDALGTGWSRALASTFGEHDLRELLRGGVGERAAGAIASGWAGGRYRFWRRDAAGGAPCAAPCARRDAFALTLRLDSPQAARAVGGALGLWLRSARGARPAPGGDGVVGGEGTTRWRIAVAAADGAADRTGVPGAGAAIATRGETVRLALAPTVPRAVLLTR